MPDSVLEQIRDNIKTTLEGVTTGAGYANTLTVEVRNRRGNAPQATQKLAVLYQGNAIKLPNVSHDQTGWDQIFFINLFADPDEDASGEVDENVNSLLADVEKALLLDESSRTRGGLAFDTRELAPVFFPADGGTQGVQVRIVVRYFTAFNDPFTAAGM